ncbi:MAG TPA: hypothetical protein VI547_05510 [Anaerolineales bacterium]|nr:hypothetical protein [Anaerolineales bacterium]HLF01410.1 hypothetical protein [Anaerolineales bacterium]
MSKPNLRLAIIVLTLITAVIHLALNLGGLQPGFLANAIGYVVLMVAFFKWVNLPFLAGREKLIWYVYMGYTALTVVAYFAINPTPFTSLIGLFDKAVEVLLIAALWLHKDNS